MKHVWLWRFLIVWHVDKPRYFGVGFYPDYERPLFWWTYDQDKPDRKAIEDFWRL